MADPHHARWPPQGNAPTTRRGDTVGRGSEPGSVRDAAPIVHGYSGRIVSFEPDPISATALRQTAADDPLWDVYELAVGDVDGHTLLHRFEGDSWNSLHEIDDAQLAESRRSIERTEPVECEVVRLDSMWADLVSPGDRVFLKSDAQGHDLAVVEGAAGDPRRHRRNASGSIDPSVLQG